MVYAHFERLSAMDLSFLAMEDGRAHMHIGSVSIYDAEPLRVATVPSTSSASCPSPRRSSTSSLDCASGSSGCLASPTPGGWTTSASTCASTCDTPRPPPGDIRQLKRLAGRVLSQEFDRAKPLWEYWFVDSVVGNRFAVISKMHHCMADGISGVTIGNLLVGPDPDYEPAPRREWVAWPAPSGTQLIVDELRHRITAPIRLLRAERPRTSRRGSAAPTRTAFGGLLGNVLHGASPTPLNVDIGPHRRFDWT